MQTLSQSIGQYLEMCEYERNLSPDTIKAYRIDLRQFSEFTKYEWADRNLLNQYIKHLNQNFAPRSVKRKLASLRAFYHEQEFNGALQESPFHKLHIRIQAPKQLPRIIPNQLVHDLLQSAYDDYSPDKRNVLRDILFWNCCSVPGFGFRSCAVCPLKHFCLKSLSCVYWLTGRAGKNGCFKSRRQN